MAPKRTTRSTPVTPTPNATPTTTVTEAQLQALIDQGVAAAMALPALTARDLLLLRILEMQPWDFHWELRRCHTHRWFEKMESVFSIGNCTASQVKFATCTLQDDALTWWNAHVKTYLLEAAQCHVMGNT
ncbi:hypothetical protein Tco_0092371 [Tanacetum coccineum]|uniref:Reverse transcriptase domain-containing protein n=1 Tax=Tanacetum coccineum TaxID=301880 RepID=A0ABQ4YC05_9ASTR